MTTDPRQALYRNYDRRLFKPREPRPLVIMKSDDMEIGFDMTRPVPELLIKMPQDMYDTLNVTPMVIQTSNYLGFDKWRIPWWLHYAICRCPPPSLDTLQMTEAQIKALGLEQKASWERDQVGFLAKLKETGKFDRLFYDGPGFREMMGPKV